MKLLWVNVGAAQGLREMSTTEFSRLCAIEEVDVDALGCRGLQCTWDVACFNFDYPDMSGLKLVCDTKQRWPSMPIVMLTMQSSVEIALWALRSKVFDLLIKPVTPQEVERCVLRTEDALMRRNQQERRKFNAPSSFMPVEARYRPRTVLSARLDSAKAHVSKHFGRHIPESEVAHLCEMSPSRFCREFKAAMGMTFVEYLANFRVTQAKRLLLNPEMSIGDAAAAVGFSDPSYFTRVFRKHAGISPTEFRTSPAVPDARLEASEA